MNRLPITPDPIAVALGQLHRAGWTVGQFATSSEAGELVWVFTGSNGENLLRAEGATAAEAWGRAVEAARGLGMLGRAGAGEAG